MIGPLNPRFVEISGRYGWIAAGVQAVFWGGFIMAVSTLLAREYWADGRLFDAWATIAIGYGIPIGCAVLLALVATGKIKP